MKTIVITGGANGVGLEVAKTLGEGNNIVLLDNDEKGLQKAEKNLGVETFVCDVADEKQIEETVAKISKKYKTIDCLINCAGMWISGDLSKMNLPGYSKMNELERIKKVIDTNVFGTIAMIKSVYPIMKKQGGGQIININSQSGVVIEPPFPVYNASKHGSNAFRRAVQDDLAHSNIKITDVCPGLINTDFYKRAKAQLPKEILETGLSPKAVANVVRYVFELPAEITIPSIEIKHIKNY